MLARAVDQTAQLAGRRLLVLSPHPDDETLGCGATIARARAAGNSVTVVVATDGRHSTRSRVVTPQRLAEMRAAEFDKACRALGVADGDVVRLDFEDGTLAAKVPDLVRRFGELIAEREPEVVLVPSAQDPHPDHRALHTALTTVAATLPHPPAVLAYPVWTWMHAPWFLAAGLPAWRLRLWALRQTWGRPRSGSGGWVRVDSRPHLAAKATALDAYASQLSNLTGESSWSFLTDEFRVLFLQPTEVFQRVRPGR